MQNIPKTGRKGKKYKAMKFKSTQFIIALSLLIIGIAIVVTTTLPQATKYYVTVDEFLMDTNKYQEQSIKLAGRVVPGSIEKNTEDLTWVFKVRGAANTAAEKNEDGQALKSNGKRAYCSDSDPGGMNLTQTASGSKKGGEIPPCKSTGMESGQTVAVFYQGAMPDTFKDESDVVLTGTYKGEQFVATEVLAKCASRYEEKLEAPLQMQTVSTIEKGPLHE